MAKMVVGHFSANGIFGLGIQNRKIFKNLQNQKMENQPDF